ncbi:uncharacterized protein LOC135534328 [Oncorhynchus masou masou]|uniref:uncharacterized protein LOC135534328 n=1 Tax=Oncorhynchus masou masou TaxID=90313 RepID=UPI0031834986
MDSLLELSVAAEHVGPLPPLLSGFELTAALLSPQHNSSKPDLHPHLPTGESAVPLSPPRRAPPLRSEDNQDMTTDLTEEFDVLIDRELENLTIQQEAEERDHGDLHSSSSSSSVSSLSFLVQPADAQQQALPQPLQSSPRASRRGLPGDQPCPDRVFSAGQASGPHSPVSDLSLNFSGGAAGYRRQRSLLDFSHLTSSPSGTDRTKPSLPLDPGASDRPSAFQAYRKLDQFTVRPEGERTVPPGGVAEGARTKTSVAGEEERLNNPSFWNTRAPEFQPHGNQTTRPAFIVPVALSPSSWHTRATPASHWLAQGPVGQVPTVPRSWTGGVSAGPRAPLLSGQHGRLRLEGRVLVLLRGAPGSGKSTLARAMLEQNPHGVVLSTDDYFCRHGDYRYDPSALGEAHEWNHARAQEVMEASFSPVIIDNTNIYYPLTPRPLHPDPYTLTPLHPNHVNGLCFPLNNTVFMSSAQEVMEASFSPVIIDNTNMQGWEMKPYVTMALRHNYKVLFREPSTWWKNKPRELERRTRHSVKAEKIRWMMENYDRHVTIHSIMGSSHPNLPPLYAPTRPPHHDAKLPPQQDPTRPPHHDTKLPPQQDPSPPHHDAKLPPNRTQAHPHQEAKLPPPTGPKPTPSGGQTTPQQDPSPPHQEAKLPPAGPKPTHHNAKLPPQQDPSPPHHNAKLPPNRTQEAKLPPNRTQAHPIRRPNYPQQDPSPPHQEAKLPPHQEAKLPPNRTQAHPIRRPNYPPNRTQAHPIRRPNYPPSEAKLPPAGGQTTPAGGQTTPQQDPSPPHQEAKLPPNRTQAHPIRRPNYPSRTQAHPIRRPNYPQDPSPPHQEAKLPPTGPKPTPSQHQTTPQQDPSPPHQEAKLPPNRTQAHPTRRPNYPPAGPKPTPPGGQTTPQQDPSPPHQEANLPPSRTQAHPITTPNYPPTGP